MILNAQGLKTLLGSKYDPEVDYKLAPAGKAAGAFNQGYEKVAEVKSGSDTVLVLAPAKKKIKTDKLAKSAGVVT